MNEMEIYFARENVIYTKIKMTGKQKEFMKDYIERKENENNGR